MNIAAAAAEESHVPGPQGPAASISYMRWTPGLATQGAQTRRPAGARSRNAFSRVETRFSLAYAMAHTARNTLERRLLVEAARLPIPSRFSLGPVPLRRGSTYFARRRGWGTVCSRPLGLMSKASHSIRAH